MYHESMIIVFYDLRYCINSLFFGAVSKKLTESLVKIKGIEAHKL